MAYSKTCHSFSFSVERSFLSKFRWLEPVAIRMPLSTRKIAVVGTGISGNVCSFFLSRQRQIDVYEAAGYIGGHAQTSTIQAYGREFDIDTGFMVFNYRTYPNFVRLLNALGVKDQPSDMSFSVRSELLDLEYCGSDLNTLFAQRRNLFSPRFLKMLLDILRFNRTAPALIDSDDDQLSLGEYLQRESFGREFVKHYLVPMGAAIWSARPDKFLEFPARFLVAFLHNHGLLKITDRPQWKTIAGRSKTYVDALTRGFRDQIRLNCPVRRIERHEDHVLLYADDDSPQIYDEVVLATHADQALAILADPTPEEREVLGQFPYQTNEAIVHTDRRLLPKRKRAWASWNYHIPKPDGAEGLPVALTYELNRLQRLESPGPVCVTLNHSGAIDEQQIIKRFTYQHPVYSPGAIAAQRRWNEISGVRRTHFCGAYWGNGFHEDGVNSGMAVARQFGIDIDECVAASTKDLHPIAG